MFILHRLPPYDLGFDQFHDGLQTYVYFCFLAAMLRPLQVCFQLADSSHMPRSQVKEEHTVGSR